MVWVKMDDIMPEHPKVAGLTDKAFRAYVRSICYSARTLADGVVPGQLARSWAALKFCEELVSAGLWEHHKKGYLIHDYHDWNDTKEQVLDRRRKDSERKRGGFPSASDRPAGVGEGVGNLRRGPFEFTGEILKGES